MTQPLTVEIVDNPLKGVSFRVNLKEPIKEKGPWSGGVISPPRELEKAFMQEIPLLNMISPQISFWIKLFPMSGTTECESELEALRSIRQSEYFHLVPACLPKPYRVKVVEAPPRHINVRPQCCIIMEWVHGDELTEWFGRRFTSVSLPIILHQFLSVWFELFDFLKFLHLSSPPRYHGDLHPGNVRFCSNMLHLVDFQSLTMQSPCQPYGTAFYVPNYVLDKTRRDGYPPDYRVDGGYLDLYCAGMMLLQVFVDLFSKFGRKSSGSFLSSLQTIFQQKEEAYGQYKEEENWRDRGKRHQLLDTMKKHNELIYDTLQRWSENEQSVLSSSFTSLLDENSVMTGIPIISRTYDQVLKPTLADYVDSAKVAMGFCDTRGHLISSKLPRDFESAMSQLLVNYSRSIFSHSYPLLYLDYSDHTGVYDGQAKAATEIVLESSEKKDSCLDLGCGFGTAALCAAQGGFKQVYRLDNNPYFHRLAGVLWAEGLVRRWKDYFPSAEMVFSAIYGDEWEKRVQALLEKYNEEFKKYTMRTEKPPVEWRYKVADYWRVGLEIPMRNFDYIICNNFLHWPIIDFEQMNRDCSGYYEEYLSFGQSKDGLGRLLNPLLQKLSMGGCLVIVEPSQFFKDDTSPEDEVFHKKRFSEDTIYQAVQRWARETLAWEVFGITWSPLNLRNKDIKFLWSTFEGLRDEGYIVELEKREMPMGGKTEPNDGAIQEVWFHTIIGEFTMTLRNLSSAQLQSVSRQKVNSFYEKFRNHLMKQQYPQQRPPVEPTYIVTIRSGAT